MGKFICKCGNTIRTSGEIPNPNEWLAISDVKYDSFETTMTLNELYRHMLSVFVCDRCQRLWIYSKGFDSEPTPYKIDE